MQICAALDHFLFVKKLLLHVLLSMLQAGVLAKDPVSRTWNMQ